VPFVDATSPSQHKNRCSGGHRPSLLPNAKVKRSSPRALDLTSLARLLPYTFSDRQALQHHSSSALGQQASQEPPARSDDRSSKDRSFVRKEIWKRRVVLARRDPDAAGQSRRRRCIPSLVWSSSRKQHNKLMHALNGNTVSSTAYPILVADQDRSLEIALRGLGFPVMSFGPGPWSAAQDAPAMLAPLGFAFHACSRPHVLEFGLFILWQDFRYFGVRTGVNPIIVDGTSGIASPLVAVPPPTAQSEWYCITPEPAGIALTDCAHDVLGLVAATVRHPARRLRAPIDAVNDFESRSLCLVLALRTLRVPVVVPLEFRGPLLAIRDGSALVEPFGLCIYRIPLSRPVCYLPAGSYLLWIHDHFLPLLIPEYSRWVRLPAGSALFHVARGRDLQTMRSVRESVLHLSALRRSNRERMGDLAGRLVVARLLGLSHSYASLAADMFARMSIHSIVEGRLSLLLPFLEDLRGGSVDERWSISPLRSSAPREAPHSSRRERNREAHATHGNAGLARVDAPPRDDEDLSPTVSDHSSIEDVAGPGGNTVFVSVLSTRRGSEHLRFESEFARSLLAVGEEGSANPIAVNVHDSSSGTSFAFYIAGLQLWSHAPWQTHMRGPALLLVDTLDDADRIQQAQEQLFSLDPSVACAVLLANSQLISWDAWMTLLRAFAEGGASVLSCSFSPPPVPLLLRGILDLRAGAAAPPWVDLRRLSQIETELEDVLPPIDPLADAPASLATVRGPPLRVERYPTTSVLLRLTAHPTAWDIQIRGLLPFRGLWCAESATLSDLRSALDAFGWRSSQWRFVAEGVPLRSDAPLGSWRGRSIEAIARVLGGVPPGITAEVEMTDPCASSSAQGLAPPVLFEDPEPPSQSVLVSVQAAIPSEGDATVPIDLQPYMPPPDTQPDTRPPVPSNCTPPMDPPQLSDTDPPL
jgi:hypothetical protein